MKFQQLILISFIIAFLMPGRNIAQDLPSACTNAVEMYGTTGLPGSIFVWDVTGGQIIQNYNDSIAVQWDNNPGIHSITCKEVTAGGCVSPIGTGYVVLRQTSVDLGASKTLCNGQSLTLHPNGNYTSYLWQDGSTGSDLVTAKGGIYWVEVTSSDGCKARDTVTVSLIPNPKVNLGNDTMICAPDEVALDAGNSGASYHWSNGDISEISYAHEGDGQIWVKVTDNYGCVGSDTINITKCYAGNKLVIPNAFTPNGDRDNDTWVIGKYQDYPNIVVKVYDRWGRLVFVSDRGYSKSWDGTSNGKPLPMDTYYYVIDMGDGSKEIVGAVTIIR